MKPCNPCESGQTAVEFVIVTAFVGLALLVPWMDGDTPINMLVEAFSTIGDSLRIWWAWS